MTMLATRFLAVAMSLGWSWTVVADPVPAPRISTTILWPASFTGVELDTANGLPNTLVRLVLEETWEDMDTQDFQAYDVIALPDSGACDTATDESAIQFALDSRQQWSAAVTGQVFIIASPLDQDGTEPNAAFELARDGLTYAAGGPTTGLYLSLSCYYLNDNFPQSVDILDALDNSFAAGNAFVVLPQRKSKRDNLPCSMDAHVMSTALALVGVPDTDVESLACPVGQIFFDYPPALPWTVEAISTADNSDPAPVTDEQKGSEYSGFPYIMSRAFTYQGCGDGILQYPERCDQGVANNGDLDNDDVYCSTTCKCLYGVQQNGACNLRAYCGDATVEPELGEQCDLGSVDNGAEGSSCSATCTCTIGLDPNSNQCYEYNQCGNGILETNNGNDEECDLGAQNGVDGSTCTADCNCVLGVNPVTGTCYDYGVCGNGFTDTSDSEQCDQGSRNGAPGSSCSSTCQCVYGFANPGNIAEGCQTAPVCGNGVVEVGEQCDNGVAGDATICTSTCRCRYGLNPITNVCNPVPVCGNNVREVGEECDAGASGNATCSASCSCIYGLGLNDETCQPAPPTPPTCGNGVLDAGEQCDVDLVSSDLCSAACTCIYGVNNTTNPVTCLPVPECGNGNLEKGEQCDPGASSSGDSGADNATCTDSCTCLNGFNNTVGACNSAPSCGNGIVEAGEECDNGRNNVIGKVCSAVCTCIWGVAQHSRKCLPPPPPPSSTSRSSILATSRPRPPPIISSSRPAVVPGHSASSLPQFFNSSVKPRASTRPPAPSPTASLPISLVPLSSLIPASSSLPLSTSVNSEAPAMPSSSTLPDPLPPVINTFAVIGCTGSDQSYPGFTLNTTSDKMTLELCTAACTGRVYAGVHEDNCYCSDRFDNVTVVARQLCTVDCPGNPAENCGGYRAVSRLVRRQGQGAVVPANFLLAIYVNATAASRLPPAVSSKALPPVGQVSASELPPGGLLPSGVILEVPGTTSATPTAATTAAAAVSSVACVGNYCHALGYTFEACQGLPPTDEAIFLPQPFSCLGGWGYVPTNCSNTEGGCGDQTVYRAVPCTTAGGGGGDAVVYQPQVCDECLGGVSFVQTPPLTGGSGYDKGGHSGGNNDHNQGGEVGEAVPNGTVGSSPSSPPGVPVPIVAIAGAGGQVIRYLGSFSMLIAVGGGIFAILL